MFVWTIRIFWKERPQFTLRSLFLVTLGVAVLCSMSYYLPVAPIIALAAFPTIIWLWMRSQ